MRTGTSGVSGARSRVPHLDESARVPREAFLGGTEFAHLHGDGSGSPHLTLPRPRAAEAVRREWAEQHPAVALGLAAPTLLMLYGPRTLDEFAVVRQLARESHAFGRAGAGATWRRRPVRRGGAGRCRRNRAG
ncbi:luciferase family protein [Streptomyces sp. B3I7]|uniref:luciferase domain-containing protein n=1 Tax=Streptomyces sp. B3I7 TaxID=3042269 RepID=UPI0027D7E415|nr:luciferase family protein [Streptomyces sp. B3I7]